MCYRASPCVSARLYKQCERAASAQSSADRQRDTSTHPASQPASQPDTQPHSQQRHAAQERNHLLPPGVPASLCGRLRQAQEGEAEEVRVSDDEGPAVLQLPLVRPPRLLGPRPPRLRQHHGAEHRLLHPGHGVSLHRHHLRVRQASGDGSGDRSGARAHVRARQGLQQEDGLVLDVLQAEQGAVRLRDIQPHRRLAPALHPLQEAPLHGRGALLAPRTPLLTPSIPPCRSTR